MDMNPIPGTGAYVPPPPPAPRADVPRAVRPEELLPYQAPEAPSDDRETEESARSPEAVKSDLDYLAKLVEQLGYRLEYGLYEGTREFYARVTDPRTQEIVKHIPSEEVLELHRRLHVMVGNFLDQLA